MASSTPRGGWRWGLTIPAALLIAAVVTYGAEGITATIWLSWVVPLLVCEIALQWQRASPLKSSS